MDVYTFIDGWLHGFASAQRDALAFLDNVQRELSESPDIMVGYLKKYFSVDEETLIVDRIWVNDRLAEWYVKEIL